MFLKKNLSLLIIMAWACFAKAQVEQTVIIDKISSKELTNHFITALFQDQKGYLWVGTLSGLNKYNGYGFTRFRCIPGDSSSISHPAITCFSQTQLNTVVAGTRKGLSVYNYNTNAFRRVMMPSHVKNADRKNNIQCMLSGKGGEHLIGTHDGIMLYSEGKGSFSPISYSKGFLLEGWKVNSMCFDRLGNLWIAARQIGDSPDPHRIFRYTFSTQKLQEYVIDKGLSEHVGISEDYLGNIWISMDHGLMMMNPGTGKQSFFGAPYGFYSCVSYSHTKDNTIWQGYWSFGLTAFDIDKKEFKVYRNDPDNPKSLMSNKCWALLKDDNEILWIGSDVGLQKITSKRPAIEIIRRNNKNTEKSFMGNIVTSVLACRSRNNIVLAGIDGEGFSIYNRMTKEAVNFGPNASNKNIERFVNQFLEDVNGDIYIVGQNCFQKLRFVNGKPQLKQYYGFQEHYGACVIQDPLDSNKLWVGGRGEIFSFDKKKQQLEFHSAPQGMTGVFHSAFISHGQIYLTHRNGLLKIDPELGTFTDIKLPDVGNILSAAAMSEDEIFLSSQYLGLIKFFPRSGKFEAMFNRKNEYFSEASDLLLYKSNLWVTGSRGIIGISLLNDERTELTTDDGLPSDVVHNMDLLDGYFYLATQDGLAIINPDFQVSHFITPKTDVTRFHVLTDNTLLTNVRSGDLITLSEKQNSFRIDFTVLDFNIPDKNRFKFKFAPIENTWQKPAGENFLIFNSLPAGNYKFELIGSNADQIWSTEPFVINIRIVPPFYKTTWFMVIGISLILFSTALIVWLRLRADHNKQIMLERIIKERTAEIQAQKAELLDSISYAQRIQKAIFVGENALRENLSNSFIYYKPKDKVSGDFFWIGRYQDLLVIFSGDCTGHGVPGAMLSIVGTALLNKIVLQEEICMPGQILTRLNNLFYEQLTLNSDNIRDGMDASVITLNLVNGEAYYAGAKLDAAYVENGVLHELKAQRHTIGENLNTDFSTQTIPSGPNRFFYLYSDGIRDQHGGPDEKKLSGKRFRDILLKASVMTAEEQRRYVSETVSRWKAGLPQTDDMMLIGFGV